jgi:hypothetical protein
MANNTVISYKDIGIHLINGGKKPTHIVTDIFVDNFHSVITVNIQKGNEVDTVNITMQYAREIGLINLQALENYCK